ncbi:hypothetical protein QJS10_CPB18g00062 [Acorus calamus]|uniref:Uncharacterized protein n=1 Tax=Acorus calamus TaxID=4465 RepID=A0AAV9CMF6_ACOCL|nr:hypothetical protein QJS10_CPB18g00062 [Acorus calamus]
MDMRYFVGWDELYGEDPSIKLPTVDLYAAVMVNWNTLSFESANLLNVKEVSVRFGVHDGVRLSFGSSLRFGAPLREILYVGCRSYQVPRESWFAN